MNQRIITKYLTRKKSNMITLALLFNEETVSNLRFQGRNKKLDNGIIQEKEIIL
jgi:hypothetical protein